MNERETIPVLEAWRALLGATVDAVILIDHRGRIELFNPAAEKLFGYAARELLGQNVNALMPEPDHGSHDRYMENYMRTHERHIIGIGRDVVAKRKDGSLFPVHLSIGQIADADPPRFVGVLHDISLRRATMDALQKERDLARRYLEIAQVALMVLDANNRVVLINRKGCEILRRSEAEIVGADWCQLAIPQERRQAVSEQLAGIRCHGGDQAPEDYNEYEIVDSEGNTRLVAWRGVCMAEAFSGAGTLLLSGDDITERRLADESARRTADRMNEVARLASLGEMAGGIAHEINQPLTAISNYAQASFRMLAQPATDMADVREALQEIASQALRAGEIIRRLRNLIRKKETQQEPATIDALITDVVGFFAFLGLAFDVGLDIGFDIATLPSWTMEVRGSSVIARVGGPSDRSSVSIHGDPASMILVLYERLPLTEAVAAGRLQVTDRRPDASHPFELTEIFEAP